MAHAGSLEQDQYNCAICQEELNDPVTLPCGHNFCKACINGFWDLGVYVCPQCSQSFTTRFDLGTNEMLVNMIRAVSALRAESQNVSRSEVQSDLVSRLRSLMLNHMYLHKKLDNLCDMVSKVQSRRRVLGMSLSQAPEAASVPQAAPAPEPSVVVKDEDDDIDLFGSEDEDEEAERIKAQRVQEYAAKKAKKPVLIAKSSIILDVKPWDDETDMAKLEECVRSVQMDGLLWGASKLVPVGYDIKKLQINCVVEDDKVRVDILEEEITKFEDYVQSVDVAAFNQI